MSNRDWEKELAEIDRRIAEGPAPDAPGQVVPDARAVQTRGAAGAPTRPPAPGPMAGAAPAVAGRRNWAATAGLVLRLAVTTLLLAGVIVWPYETRCGPWLAGYLATIGVTGLGALWTSAAAWRHRAAAVHVLSLAIFLAAGVYGAMEVLPRVGYAMPDPIHPAMWACR